jgi:hypothetical protein
MILQNAYATPDGHILVSDNDKNVEHFDSKSNILFHICGGKGLLINNINHECTPYFLTDDSSLTEIKNKLLWRTIPGPIWEHSQETAVYKPLLTLESDHLKAILSKNIPHLHKYIIGRILSDRKVKFRLQRKP